MADIDVCGVRPVYGTARCYLPRDGHDEHRARVAVGGEITYRNVNTADATRPAQSTTNAQTSEK